MIGWHCSSNYFKSRNRFLDINSNGSFMEMQQAVIICNVFVYCHVLSLLPASPVVAPNVYRFVVVNGYLFASAYHTEVGCRVLVVPPDCYRLDRTRPCDI